MCTFITVKQIQIFKDNQNANQVNIYIYIYFVLYKTMKNP